MVLEAFGVRSIFTEEVITGGERWIRRVAKMIPDAEREIRADAGGIWRGEIRVRGGAGAI